MKKFIENNFTVIVLVIALLTFFKGCGDSREITKIKNEIKSIKDSTYTKAEMKALIQIERLKTVNDWIQTSDRRILDVNKQSQNDEMIKKLEEKIK